jgi:hypothetical protein
VPQLKHIPWPSREAIEARRLFKTAAATRKGEKAFETCEVNELAASQRKHSTGDSLQPADVERSPRRVTKPRDDIMYWPVYLLLNPCSLDAEGTLLVLTEVELRF